MISQNQIAEVQKYIINIMFEMLNDLNEIDFKNAVLNVQSMLLADVSVRFSNKNRMMQKQIMKFVLKEAKDTVDYTNKINSMN